MLGESKNRPRHPGFLTMTGNSRVSMNVMPRTLLVTAQM
jgi:hypothetical protein